MRTLARNVLLHDRVVVLATLFAIVAMAWAWLLLGAGMRVTDSALMTPMAPVWTASYALLMYVMWVGMMLAMMLPAAAPTILLVAALMRGRGSHRILGATRIFVAGYLLIWFGFSAAATAMQWGLSRCGWLSSGMASNSSMLTALLLVAAGIYQWTRIKQACLTRCRSPAASLTKYWHRGAIGPLLAGLQNGAYCLGCCGMLMVLLFVGGVMNLVWVAVLALLVLLEKALPFHALVSRASGAVLVVAGVLALFG